MTCRLCSALGQLADNTALIADKALNTISGGDPNETFSRRIARARDAGQTWARRCCAGLTWAFNLLPGIKRDHCTWSLEPGSIGAEVWHWSSLDSVQKTLVVPSGRVADDARNPKA